MRGSSPSLVNSPGLTLTERSLQRPGTSRRRRSGVGEAGMRAIIAALTFMGLVGGAAYASDLEGRGRIGSETSKCNAETATEVYLFPALPLERLQ